MENKNHYRVSQSDGNLHIIFLKEEAIKLAEKDKKDSRIEEYLFKRDIEGRREVIINYSFYFEGKHEKEKDKYLSLCLKTFNIIERRGIGKKLIT